MITNDARCTQEIKSRISMANAFFNKKKSLFTSKLVLNLRETLVKFCTLSIALFGAETWTLRKVDHIFCEVLKCGAGGWRRSAGPIMWEMKKYHTEFMKRKIFDNQLKKGRLTGLVYILRRNCLLEHVFGGRIKVTGRRGRRCKQQLLDDLKGKRWYCKLK